MLFSGPFFDSDELDQQFVLTPSNYVAVAETRVNLDVRIHPVRYVTASALTIDPNEATAESSNRGKR